MSEQNDIMKEFDLLFEQVKPILADMTVTVTQSGRSPVAQYFAFQRVLSHVAGLAAAIGGPACANDRETLNAGAAELERVAAALRAKRAGE